MLRALEGNVLNLATPQARSALNKQRIITLFKSEQLEVPVLAMRFGLKAHSVRRLLVKAGLLQVKKRRAQTLDT